MRLGDVPELWSHLGDVPKLWTHLGDVPKPYSTGRTSLHRYMLLTCHQVSRTCWHWPSFALSKAQVLPCRGGR